MSGISRVSEDPRYHVFVNDSGGRCAISGSLLSLTGLVAATWTSVGPTGSGATIIWSALDSIPTCDWIEINFLQEINYLSGGAGVFRIQSDFGARKNGSAVTFPLGNDLLISTIDDQRYFSAAYTLKVSDSVGARKIPLDSNKIFEVVHGVVAPATAFAASAGLIGYGWNRPLI